MSGGNFHAEVAKLADAQDLKSCDLLGRAGSIPALGTFLFNGLRFLGDLV